MKTFCRPVGCVAEELEDDSATGVEAGAVAGDLAPVGVVRVLVRHHAAIAVRVRLRAVDADVARARHGDVLQADAAQPERRSSCRDRAGAADRRSRCAPRWPGRSDAARTRHALPLRAPMSSSPSPKCHAAVAACLSTKRTARLSTECMRDGTAAAGPPGTPASRCALPRPAPHPRLWSCDHGPATFGRGWPRPGHSATPRAWRRRHPKNATRCSNGT